MLNSLYNLTNKGSLRTLSFILALLLTLCFLSNFHQFATQLRIVNPIFVICLIWSICVLWVHGFGFEIKTTWLKIFFLPVVSYLVVFIAIIHNIII